MLLSVRGTGLAEGSIRLGVWLNRYIETRVSTEYHRLTPSFIKPFFLYTVDRLIRFLLYRLGVERWYTGPISQMGLYPMGLG